MGQYRTTMQEKERLVQLLTTKFNVDELHEFLKKDKCKVEILPIQNVSKWVAVKDALPLVDTFYLVASSNLQNWTKALYKNGEFHTIENIIDWNITHWRYIKPPCW